MEGLTRFNSEERASHIITRDVYLLRTTPHRGIAQPDTSGYDTLAMPDIEIVSECYSVTEVSEAVASSGKSSLPLTPREIEIVALLAEGKSNKQVAAELGISVRTVEGHRRHIMVKTHVRSLVELIYYALEHGIVTRR